MENLEKDEQDLKESCGCCCDCDCGNDCHCTEDNKCCEECTCPEHKKDSECNTCKCGEEHKENEDIKDNETCKSEDDVNSSCDCDEKCDCDDECECAEGNKCNEDCNCDELEQNDEPDKCKCGCGEDVEENLSDTYFKRLLSLQAEFDNYRKRTQNDISKAYQNGFNEAITEFLPALDSFKMATEYITDQNTLIGIQYIEKGILATLEKMGITVIDVSGKFDPNFHQAIGSEVNPGHESGDIIKECFKGFMMGEKVIRYSQVIVAK